MQAPEQRELQMKKWKRAWKIELIETSAIRSGRICTTTLF